MKKAILLILAVALILLLPTCKSGANLDPFAAAETYLHSGNEYYKKAEFTRALSDYDQAIRLNPALAEAFNNRGYVYFVRGENDKAIADFETALKLDPHYTSAKNNLERAKQ